jgi:hypothetical protein
VPAYDQLKCGKCDRVSDSLALGWAALHAVDIDGVEPTFVVCFCPECAASEFGFVPWAEARASRSSDEAD